jgi:hypothetical protein
VLKHNTRPNPTPSKAAQGLRQILSCLNLLPACGIAQAVFVFGAGILEKESYEKISANISQLIKSI